MSTSYPTYQEKYTVIEINPNNVCKKDTKKCKTYCQWESNKDPKSLCKYIGYGTFKAVDHEEALCGAQGYHPDGKFFKGDFSNRKYKHLCESAQIPNHQTTWKGLTRDGYYWGCDIK